MGSQPSTPGGRGTQTRLAAGFVEADEEVEAGADPEVEEQEGDLHGAPDELGLIGLPPHEGHLDGWRPPRRWASPSRVSAPPNA